jgi:hypothetical protein
LKIRGVLLFLAVFCSVLASPAVAATSGQVVPGAQQAAPRVTANPFGIPFPASRDPQQRRAWQEHVRAQLEARRNTHVRANASGPSGSGIIETIAGAAPFQQPVNALKTGLGNEIEALTEESGGNLYVASCDLGVVLKIDPSSNTTVYAGTPLPVGPVLSAGDGGPASSARIGCPAGLALDSSNNLYISDAFSATVLEVDAATGIIQTIAGTPGQFGHGGDGGPGTSALLTYPTGLALDGQGNLFIEDEGYVWRLNLTTGVIQTFAGSGLISNPCLPSATSVCPALQTNFYFSGPTIAAHGGYLYAAPAYIFVNPGQLDSSIVSINLSSGSVQLLAGGGPLAGTPTSAYPALGLLLNANSLAVDGAGNLFFSGQYQAGNGGVQPNLQPDVDGIFEMSASDNSVRAIAGTSTPSNTTGDGGSATSAEIAAAGAMCLTPKGGVVFSDGSFNLRTFPIGGNLSTIAGDGWPNFFGDNGPAQQAGLTNPYGVATDAQGNVYVADTGNERARKIDAVTGVITTVAGGATPQNADAELSPPLQPVAVALDQSDRLYARSEGVIKSVDLNTGTVSTLLTEVPVIGPIAFDGNRTLYYSSNLSYGTGSQANNGVWAVDITTGTTTQIAGGNAYAAEPSGDGGPALQAGLSDVEGLALDGQGGLYLADSGFEDIRKIDLNTGIISTVAGVANQVGYSGDGGPATAATFYDLAGLAYDGAGHLTVADVNNNVLRQIDLATNIITTIAGTHTAGFSGDGGSPTGAMLYDPRQVAYDLSGNLLIADSKNYRVRRVVLHPTKLNAALTYGAASSGGVTFTATYSGLSFGIAPTGSVTFLGGSTSLGTGTIAAATDGSGNYVATLTATSVPGNGATLTAQYSGDTNYAALTTTAAFQPPTPSYTISAKPASLTVKQGASGSVTFTVTPQNGFAQAVSFQCDNSTLPQGVTCSFSPASVTPNETAAVTSTMTIATTGATATALDRRATHGFGWLPGGAVLALLLFGIPGTPRRFWSGVLMLVVLSIGCAITIGGGIIGCGGGGSGNTGGGGSRAANATPPSAYSIQVTTSAGSATSTLPVTLSLTVTQ